MSDLSPLSGEERKLDFGAVKSVDEPNRTYAAPLCPKRPGKELIPMASRRTVCGDAQRMQPTKVATFASRV